MPLRRVTKDGRPGWQYGKHGAVYTYKAGNAASEKKAKNLAIKQGLAVQYESGEKVEF